jgi:hypothetical protein
MWFVCVALWFTCTSSNFADPIDIAALDGVRAPVQRVADDSVAGLYAGRVQPFDQHIGHSV